MVRSMIDDALLKDMEKAGDIHITNGRVYGLADFIRRSFYKKGGKR